MPQDLKNSRAMVKEPATIKAQMDKLRQRGCIIEDEAHACQVLKAVNYYRLAHYFAIFLADKTHYMPGTSFERVLRLYDFDRSLRGIVIVALEEIEVNLRAIISNYHALRYGALGYLNASTFDRTHKHQPFLSKIERMIELNAQSDLVMHHKKKYAGAFPLWVIMELFSFGTLAYFYLDMHKSDKKEIAEANFSEYHIKYAHLDSWMNCLCDLRNLCAHYNRLYAANLHETPRQLDNLPFPCQNTVFDYLMVMKYLFKRKQVWNESVPDKLHSLALEYADVADVSVLGFPTNWKELLLHHDNN